MIHSESRRMAGSYMRRERPSHTLQATALVNEVYMRLAGGPSIPCQNRAHFFGVAAHAMRQVLLDYARGGYIDVELRGFSPKLESVVAIDEALDRPERIDPRQSRLIELRFFAGMSVEEAAGSDGRVAP